MSRHLNESQRAMVAGRVVEYSKNKIQQWQKEKNSWIQSARANSHNGDRQPCSVCHKYLAVTQAHHLIPLHKQYDRKFVTADHSIVWLCPTHHAAVHRIIETNKWHLEGFDESEFNTLLDIAVKGV